MRKKTLEQLKPISLSAQHGSLVNLSKSYRISSCAFTPVSRICVAFAACAACNPTSDPATPMPDQSRHPGYEHPSVAIAENSNNNGKPLCLPAEHQQTDVYGMHDWWRTVVKDEQTELFLRKVVPLEMVFSKQETETCLLEWSKYVCMCIYIHTYIVFV